MKKLIVFSVFLFACTEGYVTDRDYPRFAPLHANKVTSNSVFVSIEIFHNTVAVSDHGFIISTSGFATLDNGTKVSKGPLTGAGSASHTFTLSSARTHYIRAYAICPGHVVYSTSEMIE